MPTKKVCVKDNIAGLMPDKIHPVPSSIPPGSFLYHLFKARFQNDISASIKVRNMIQTNSEGRIKEQSEANRLLNMYEAGYKAGQRLNEK